MAVTAPATFEAARFLVLGADFGAMDVVKVCSGMQMMGGNKMCVNKIRQPLRASFDSTVCSIWEFLLLIQIIKHFRKLHKLYKRGAGGEHGHETGSGCCTARCGG